MDPKQFFLYDDSVARNWQPFSLTRPIGEMLFGTETIRARIERLFGAGCCGHLAGDALLGFEEPGAPRCIPVESVGNVGTRIYLNSRFVPQAGFAPVTGGGPALLTAGPAIVGACVPHGTALPPGLLAAAARLAGRTPRRSRCSQGFHHERPEALPTWPMRSVSGRLLETVWELMAANGDQLRRDGARFEEKGLPAGVHRIASGKISLAECAVIEPGVVLDPSGGPIILSQGTRVQAPARITGPLYLGPDSRILGGVVREASIGPGCRIRGEVQSCVILGFTNKAHDGFLGHSIVGGWVNLGAMTTNSDLKNTYSPVRVIIGGRRTDTGLLKVGCFLGDHVRTGIGTMLHTGTVVGAGSNLFGDGMPPRDVPPFSWGTGSDLSEYRLDRFLETAATVMARRGIKMTDGVQRLYRRVFAATTPLRASMRPR